MSTVPDNKASGSGKSVVIDVNSPYFLHAFDSPGDKFVGDLLHDGNYGDWVNEMSNSLYAKNKMGFVDGTLAVPDADSPDFVLWKRCNAMVRGWLNTAMDKKIRSSVRYAKTAAEVWHDLKERFGKESAPRAYELRRNLTLTRQEGLSVSAYYTRLRSIWDEVHSVSPMPRCNCGKCSCNIQKELNAMKEKEMLYVFLMGLNEEFSVVRTQILSIKPAPTLGEAYHLVSEDERH